MAKEEVKETKTTTEDSVDESTVKKETTIISKLRGKKSEIPITGKVVCSIKNYNLVCRTPFSNASTLSFSVISCLSASILIDLNVTGT